jgi:oxalate decarboxylase/phosphoglucose isomerase-like protein (cupin superfamily)
MKQVTLFTGEDGRARFREDDLVLDQGTESLRLSALFSGGGYQFRESPIGYISGFHCTEHPQWIVVLRGCIEILLQDGSSRQFVAGSIFFCADVLPAGEVFDPEHHGHRSRQVGEEPLQTLFVRG